MANSPATRPRIAPLSPRAAEAVRFLEGAGADADACPGTQAAALATVALWIIRADTALDIAEEVCNSVGDIAELRAAIKHLRGQA